MTHVADVSQGTSFPRWKRAMDIVGGVILLAIAALPMILVAATILLESGRPVLIRQRRIGANEIEYLMWKFRSLPVDTPQMSKADLRQRGITPTRFGRLVRRYSIDELPQLLNVVVGEMTLVGPRPALFTQDDLIALRRQAGILHLRPGLTGLAQVSGREDLTLEQKVALDAEYNRRMSPYSDLVIGLRTASAVLRGRGSF